MKFKRFLGLGMSFIMTAASLNVCMAEEPAVEEVTVAFVDDEITSAPAVETDTDEAQNSETFSDPGEDEMASAASELTPQDDVGAALADTSYDITYEVPGGSIYIDIVNGEAYVADCDGRVTSAVIPESVNYNGDDYKITSIGKSAFEDCSSLTEITLPDILTSIGDYAFSCCSSLPDINLPEGLVSIGEGAFYDCTSLTDIDLPAGLTFIGASAFKECLSLTSVKIPESITIINRDTFGYCSSLERITIPDSVVLIVDYSVFNGCYDLTIYCGSGSYAEAYAIKNKIPYSTEVFHDYIQYSITGGTVNFDKATGEIISFINTGVSNIVIPDTVDGIAVKAIGADAFYNCATITNITLPDSITSIYGAAFRNCTSLTDITMPESLTYIGNFAFKDCTLLTGITLPDSLTYIGNSAFENCTSLTKIKLPEDLTYIGRFAFSGCSSLTNINLPENLTSIGKQHLLDDYVFFGCTSLKTAGPIGGGYNIEFGWTNKIPDNTFSGCSSLTDITLPESIAFIGKSAFNGCSSLKNINLSDRVISIGKSAFDGCASLKTAGPIGGGYDYEFGWTDKIPDNAFAGCSSLTDITLPESLTSIGYSVFEGCSSLTYITLPNSLTSINGSAFKDCTSLTNITLPKSLTSMIWGMFSGCTSLKTAGPIGGGYNIEFEWTDEIPSYAFSDCRSLINIKLPNSVTSIGNAAFGYCSSLTNINLPDSVTFIDHNAFSDCESLTYIKLPDSVISIGDNVFSDCASLTNIELSKNLTSIGNWAFASCESLTDITLPDSVTFIGNYAFNYCSALTSIKILEGVTTIGKGAFRNCSVLESAVIPDSVDSIDSSAFDGCDKLTIYCSSSSYAEAYAIENKIPYSTEAFHEYIKFTIDGGTVDFDKGTGEITSFDANTSVTEILIPDVIDGIMVKAIGANAFADCNGLESVTIPAGIESIGEKAFNNCQSLKNISIPKSVKSIGADAFKGIASGAVICCYRGSTADNAELYPGGVTISYINEEIKQGDIDGDGQVTSTDANLALFKSAGIRTLSEAEINIADVDGDGKVTSTDANIILFASAGLRELN